VPNEDAEATERDGDYGMDNTKEQDNYKYRPQDWRRLPRIQMVRQEKVLRSLEKKGLIKFVNARWHAIEHAPSTGSSRQC